MEFIRMSFWVLCFVFICAFQLQLCNAFYLSYAAFVFSTNFNKFTGYFFPGLYSLAYNKGDTILLHEKRITGEIIPFKSDYGFCDRGYPALGSLEIFTLGETFSPYYINMAEDVKYKHLCTKKFVGGNIKSKEQLDALKKGMRLNLKQHWVIDNNIPALWCPEVDYVTKNGTEKRSFCESGFPIGCYSGDDMEEFCQKLYYKKPYESYFIFNHVDFIITYEGSPNFPSKSRVVYVEVVPSSINHSDYFSESPLGIPKGDIPLGKSLEIEYTYSIRFIKNSSIKWSSRWDYIFRSMPFWNLNWISYVQSIMTVGTIVFFPITIITLLYTTSIPYKVMESRKKIEPKLRWKLLTEGHEHPAVRMSLSVLLGSIIQLICMVISALGFSLLAYLKSDGRDSQMLLALSIFILLGTVGGYYSSAFYKHFGGEDWKTAIIISTISCSGIAVSVFFVLDCLLFYRDSTASLPIYSLSAFMGMMYMFIMPFTTAGFILDFHC